MRRSRRRVKRKRGGGFLLGLLTFLLLAGGAAFLYTAPQFERIPPKIEAKSKIIVGENGKIDFKVFDNYALKKVEVLLENGKERKSILDERLPKGVKEKEFHITLPKSILSGKKSDWDYEIIATDHSLWNFFMGNSTHKKGKLDIDTTAPKISIVSKSAAILKGGTALVIYRVDEDNLKESYIDIGHGIYFKGVPYKKRGIYATLIAWPFNLEQFNPKIVAVDKAGNRATLALSMRHDFKKYRVSYIAARDSFIDGKITQLASRENKYAKITDRLEKLRAINENMRLENEKLIHKVTKKATPIGDRWKVQKLYPLHGAKRVSDFGVKRYYYYKKRENIISTSYHVGYDFASIKHDKIYSSMPGKVVFAAPNGIYGNMIIIDHGLGLYTLYGHTSQMYVKVGQKVAAGEVIGLTGKTGLALGDHLHFGVLVQGVEVYPLEWMNKKWIKDFILSVFQKADTKLGYN